MTAEGDAMDGRTPRRLAFGLVALTLALMVSGEALGIASGAEEPTSAFLWAIAVVFSLVGALVAIRHPGNAIGWIFLSVGVAAGLGALTGGYADYWVGGHGGSKALGEAAAAYASYSWVAFILVPATFLLLLFPDGRLLSPRWRWVAWSASAGIAGSFVTGILTPGPLEDYPEIVNPFGVSSS